MKRLSTTSYGHDQDIPQGGEKPAKGLIKGNTSRDHIHRIFLIFSELQNQRYPSLAKLSKLCDVDSRTIQRDIGQMNAMLGSIEGDGNEIVYDTSRRGYALLREMNHLPIVQIGDKDLLTSTSCASAWSPTAPPASAAA